MKPIKYFLPVFVLSLFLFLGLSQTFTSQTEVAASPLLDDTVSFELIGNGFEQPVAIVSTNVPGDERLFIIEKPGRISILLDGTKGETPFIDINSKVINNGEQGLLSLVFDPDYASNGYFYVHYSDKDGAKFGDTVIARYQVTEDPDVADPDSEMRLLEIDQEGESNHNGGQMFFDAEGELIISMGDGGNDRDEKQYAQSLNRLLGKMLRINVHGEGMAPTNGCGRVISYTIPSSNPDPIGSESVCPEILAYGFRNPWRFSIDSQTGDIWIGDVGELKFEEISMIPAGTEGYLNFGWSCYEGNSIFGPNNCTISDTERTDPIFDYGRSLGNSVTGGHVYRGGVYPNLDGVYFFGDYVQGRFWTIEAGDEGFVTTELVDTSHFISTFGQDGMGELYFASYLNGEIYRLKSQFGAQLTLAGTESVDLGETIQYQINVKNDGSDPLTGLVLRNEVPTGASWLSGGSESGGLVSFDLGSLAAGETVSVTWEASADVPGEITNSIYTLLATEFNQNARGVLGHTTIVSGTLPTPTATATATETPTTPVSTPTPLPPTPTFTPQAPQPPSFNGTIETTLVGSGFNNPTGIASTGIAGDNRLFVLEKGGRLRILENGQIKESDFLSLEGQVSLESERGLLGLAFDPNYAQNGYFYIHYSDRRGDTYGDTVIKRYTVSSNPDIADANSGFTILEIDQDFNNHNGGWLAFAPDGNLIIGMGDGGSGNDPNNRAQSKNTLLGKFLRINVHGQGLPTSDLGCGRVRNYAIPEDNPRPFGEDGWCPEIWSYGWRNPWRYSFDAVTGDLWAGDVGQSAREEIDFEPAGSNGLLNYGWRCYEGNTELGAGNCTIPANDRVDPVVDYPRSLGTSVTGGYVYRGSQFPDMQGVYFYGDFGSGRIWSLIPDGNQFTNDELVDTNYGISAFGEASNDELYFTNFFGGEIYQLVYPFGASVSLTAPDWVQVNGEMTYSFTVTNEGTEALTTVQVENTIPAGVSHVSGGSESGGVVTLMVGNLAVGESKTVSWTGTAPSTSGEVTNSTFSISADEMTNSVNSRASDAKSTTVLPELNFKGYLTIIFP